MWNNFSSCLNDEESTISNIFCSSGIFKISSDDEVNRYPNIKASSQNKRTVVAIDSNIFLLENEEDCICNVINFKSIIDCFTTSTSGNLVICVLNDGNVHGISIKGIPLFNLKIEDVEKEIDEIGSRFLEIYQLNDSFYIKCINGGIYRLNNIDESILSEIYPNDSCLENNEQTFLLNNVADTENINLECLLQPDYTDEITICWLIVTSPLSIIPEKFSTLDLIFISATKNYLKFQYKNDTINIHLPTELQGIKKMFKTENYILALCNSGKIHEICPYTFTILSNSGSNDILIDDLVIIEDSFEQIELLILTKPNGVGIRNIKIVDFPTLKCTNDFTTSGSEHIWLVNQSKSSLNLYYLTGGKCNDKNNLPQEIEMKSISELDPSQRLKKLIYKGRLDEAEEFGKQYKLSLQPVYEMKAKKILAEINFIEHTDAEILDLKFKELIDILKLIENQEFFIQICNTDIPDRKLTKSYLEMILEHMNDERKYEKEILHIKEQILRLETLDIIDPDETNLEWQKFVQHSNILQICTSYFNKDMSKACIIWKRHISCVIQHLDKNHVIKLLNMIPINVEVINVIQWLRNFIPPISQIHSNCLPLIVDWCIEKTRSLQYSNYWPEIGLEFAKDIKDIFENLHFLYSDIFRQYENNMEKLIELVNALDKLFILKNNYKINLTLDNYLKESLDSTALEILQRANSNDLKPIIEEFLYKIYMEKLGETPKYAVILYIEFLISRRRMRSLWLEHAIICIETLHNEEDKLKCAIMVLKLAPVPWPTDTIKPLLKLRNSNHPLSNEIATEFELQIIKMIRLKYGWSSDSNENSNMKLIYRIIKLNLSDMFNDLKNVIKLTPTDLSTNANFYCCYELIRNGHIEMAVKYYSNELNDIQKLECKDKFINIFTTIINENEISDDDDDDDDGDKKDTNSIRHVNLNTKNFFEFLKLITKSSKDEYDKKLIEQLENVQILREKYHLKSVSVTNLNCKLKRQSLFIQAIKNISLLEIKNYDDNKNCLSIVTKIWKTIVELCKLLYLEKLNGFLIFCKLLNNLQITCAIGYNILQLIEPIEDINDADIFIDLSILLISQYIGVINNDEDKINIEHMDPLVYPLCYKLLCVALRYEKFDQVEIVEFLKWIRIGSSLYSINALKEYYENDDLINENIKKCLSDLATTTRKNDHHEKNDENITEANAIEIFNKVNSPKEVIEKPKINPGPVLKCISYGLLVIYFEIKPKLSVINRFHKFIPNEYLNLKNEIKLKFYGLLERLIRSKQYLCWYSIAKLFIDYQKFSKETIIDEHFISHHLKAVFRHMLTQKEPNFTYLYVILLSELNPENFLLELSNELKSEQQKMNYLTLSEMYNKNHTKNEVKAIGDNQERTRYYYYIELCKLNMNQKNKYNIKNITTNEIIKELRNSILNIKLLERISKDFQWDHQELLISQIIMILNSQELQFNIKSDAFGNEEIIMKSSSEQIYELCKSYINEITNLDLLATELLQFIPKINYYFYELYLCVVDILKFIDKLPKNMELWSSILLFLKHKMIKKRKYKQNQMETDYWLKSQPNLGILPKIAKFRIPFMPFIVQKRLENILDKEINVNSCESWFPLIQLHNSLHGITSDIKMIESQEEFCLTAVNNSTLEYWETYKQQSHDDEWNLNPINDALLQSVLRLIKHIKNPTTILFILYTVTIRAPDGIDQVQAAYECYKYAIENENYLQKYSKANEIISKIKRKYPIYKTQHLLYTYHIIDDKLLQLIESPKELIFTLYNHELILKPIKPNINRICEDISSLYNLNFNEIQLNLLHKWLSITNDTDTMIDTDETFCPIDYEDSILNCSGEIINNEYIIRASYILSSWESSRAIRFLISNIFPSNELVSTGKQLQNFECFIRLVNEETISFMNVTNQKQYITLKCVHYLNQFGYNLTMEKFNGYNKLTILKNIWQNHANNSNALEAIVHICLSYDIYVPQLWNEILKQMIKLKMFKQLDALVEILSCKPSLLFIDGLALAWNYVIKTPFKNANGELSYEQENQLHTTLLRIQSCPLIGKLNLIEICEDCIRINKINIASVLIGLCMEDNQKEQIKKIVEKYVNNNNSVNDNDLKKDILELQEIGILYSIINFVLRELKL